MTDNVRTPSASAVSAKVVNVGPIAAGPSGQVKRGTWRSRFIDVPSPMRALCSDRSTLTFYRCPRSSPPFCVPKQDVTVTGTQSYDKTRRSRLRVARRHPPRSESRPNHDPCADHDPCEQRGLSEGVRETTATRTTTTALPAEDRGQSVRFDVGHGQPDHSALGRDQVRNGHVREQRRQDYLVDDK